MLRLRHTVSGTAPSACGGQSRCALPASFGGSLAVSTTSACHKPSRGVLLAAVPEANSSGAAGPEQLQPRPQAKRARLSPAPGEAAQKPRRWHKASSQGPPVPGISLGAASQAPPAAAAAADGQSLAPSSASGSTQTAGLASAHRSERGSAGAQSGRDGGLQRGGRGSGSSSGEAQGRREGGRAAGQQRQRREAYAAYGGDDEDEEDDDGLDMEFAGLTEEELEKLVFASAGGAGAGLPAAAPMTTAASTPGGSGSSGAGSGDEQAATAAAAANAAPGAAKGSGKQGSRQGGKKGGSGISAAEALAAAQLDEALAARVQSALAADRAISDGDKLAAQLKQVMAAAQAAAAKGVGAAAPANAAAAAVGGAVAPAGAGAGPGAGGAGGVVLAAAAAVSGLLDCDADAAMGIVLAWPGYVALPYGDAEERLRALCGFLDVEAAGARQAARCNPALLLVPSDPLRRKLTALANATGLKPTQAAGMITLYMFPGSM
ncbi:hypothetical protein CHLRE_02g076550v5 [Chlamydomonas reinhardtii]|uniref:Uncharacterized protein n=1 Tax=Chlamydomonas reinhardtii TaxID=3055 RepID=A0A2K3E079_CHLRE|nr:uncharacterized protein CHLRE_02g076550v5 [Chlamydomonas reinhardtii]PNW86192.1 hypothetical protein CHLRE_02g076550v5 [Chlamydomonas reinhardtii]